MKTGNGRAPALAPEIVDLVKQAWLFASLDQNAYKVRSGHLLWALLADETLARHARDASSQLLKIAPDLLKRDFAAITANSAEAQEAGAAAAARRVARSTEGGRAHAARRRRRAGPVHHRSDGAGEGGQNRSDPRPRQRNPPDDRHPDAAAAEQSDPYG